MLPVQVTTTSRGAPLATWGLILANFVVFVFELALPEAVLEDFFYWFGIVPARYTRPDWAAFVGLPVDSYWPFLTSQFLHGGWVHILGNMWTLWLFGESVEEKMGSGRFLLFYLAGGIVAGIVHSATNPTSTIPSVGASGAISGVLAAYFLLFPRARVVVLVPLLFWPFFFDVSVFFYVAYWFLIQLFNGALALGAPGQVGGVAWWAHIGGFVWGLATMWLFLRPKKARPLFEPGQFQFEQSWKRYW